MPDLNLWNFALRCYAQPGVESACLELQSQGADVCVLLCAAWLEARRVACNEDRLHALREIAAPWQQDVIEPLRALRQAWRPLAQNDDALRELRETLKTLELQAERRLLARLQATSGAWVESSESNAWLNALAPSCHCRAGLETLRGAAYRIQLELDGF
ncbi:TIGR02444 family protein [Pseudomonas stutzeri]|uniref:TIGR02444 family protein n=1 Tax=Stutzerimonas stutzeri TaxID=316 RepID=A0A2N8RY09_STUST|nr:TIGR02444 family protein [Stutzerimonas stutzeri]MCQ4296142.1 TIGR02444 family protein [Stutzerimonas stutzeri]PNF79268.1 TIGR02444 family protein [Stutzerimonas stutzeri]